MSLPTRSIHVVAGVITDARGRVLLNRRTESRDMAGLWEFPGGKREPGESSEQALARELHEELGIEAEIGSWIMDVPQLYPDKQLTLEVRHVRSWKGTPRGREGQAITWVAPDKLSRYSMPPADLPVVAALREPASYLVLPPPGRDAGARQQWLEQVHALVRAGFERIRLSVPNADPARRELIVQAIRGQRAPVQWLIDADLELARELGTGVHLDGAQLATLAERPLPPGQLLAASCSDLAQLQDAQRLGCDFAVLGVAPDAATEKGGAALAWPAFAALRARVALPLYAPGESSDEGAVSMARRHGAQGIAAPPPSG